MSQTKIYELTALAKSKFLSLYEAKYYNKQGEDKRWYISSRKSEEALRDTYLNGGKSGVDAVVIKAIHQPTSKLVLVKQFRVPINDYIYELPAGLIDPGEDYKKSLVRELKEETGLTVTGIDESRCIDQVYLSAGMTDESASFASCTCEGELSQEFLEADEEITPMLVSKEEAKAILASGAKMDIKTYLILVEFANS